MPSKPSRTGSSNLFGERQPLLKQHTVDTLVTVRSELEAASQNGSGTHGAWKVFFFLICSICLNAVIAFIANENGEGDETNYLPPSQSSQLESPRFDYKWALWRALGGGLTGAIAALIQVVTLMPLRTTLNHQHRSGTTITKAIKTLHSNGSYSRYYQGLPVALIYRILARFGDTAANVGILALLGSNTSTGPLPSPIKTVFASLCATAFRFIITPIDTVCTTFQVEGKSGLKSLRKRIKERGITCLWSGVAATATISFVEHYFWFATYNYLREELKKQHTVEWVLSRQAFIGFCASLVSYAMLFPLVALVMMYLLFHGADSRSLKEVREIVVADGGLVLFGRGWQMRMIERGFQGAVFAVLWKVFMGVWNKYIDY
ncbi:mitochondrial carrier domain-containing protein [Thelephora terrestris]|uniref:Mitochondrial carrier domain-containing protein n=1 Tax=Thelephora terrestris TaxID=56493 RepID=A0A9P6LB54_9AGAM|nr:mitochondrial carrier domain-containing protein [Thelephora terrestris]